MKNEDMKLRQLYTELYDNTHASPELKGKVRTMTEGNKKKVRRSVKATAAIAAAAIAVIGGTLVTAANHKTYIGQYTTAYVNGEEVQARYGAWENIKTYIVEAEMKGKTYTAYIHGDYDRGAMPIYFRDEGKYIVASTNPDQQLNLYDDIDKAPHAKIDGSYLMIDDSYAEPVETPTDPDGNPLPPKVPYDYTIQLSFDMDDGKQDGVLKYGTFDYATLIVSPEGLIIESMKSRGSAMDDEFYETTWGYIWGEETWESWNDYAEAYKDSDGVVIDR